jgi:hypothetical protein
MSVAAHLTANMLHVEAMPRASDFYDSAFDFTRTFLAERGAYAGVDAGGLMPAVHRAPIRAGAVIRVIPRRGQRDRTRWPEARCRIGDLAGS